MGVRCGEEILLRRRRITVMMPTFCCLSAEMGALPLEGGVAVAFGREMAAEDPEAKRHELEMMAAAFPRFLVRSILAHDRIDPRETRPMLCAWIDRVRPLLPQLLGPTPSR